MNDLTQESLGRRLGYAMSQKFIQDTLVDIDTYEQEQDTRQLSADPQDRRLQADICEIYVNNSIFRNNIQGATLGTTTYGVISILTEDHLVSLHNCLFAENIFGDPEINVRTSAWGSWTVQF